MTGNELKQIIRVCGTNFDENDIPAYICKRDEEERDRKGGEIEDMERYGAVQNSETGQWEV